MRLTSLDLLTWLGLGDCMKQPLFSTTHSLLPSPSSRYHPTPVGARAHAKLHGSHHAGPWSRLIQKTLIPIGNRYPPRLNYYYYFKYPCILEGHLSTNPILSALHLWGPKSNIYVHFPLINKKIDGDFIPKVKPSIKHVINLEIKKNNKKKTLISIEDLIIYMACHLKGPLSI